MRAAPHPLIPTRVTVITASPETPAHSSGGFGVSRDRVHRVLRVHWVHWVHWVQQVGQKIRFMFDGKWGKMFKRRNLLDQQVHALRNATRVMAGTPYTPPPPPPLWQRALAFLGGALLTLLALLALATVVGLLAYAARIGWHLAT